MAIITIPKKKTSSPIVKEKRKAGTRAGLTKAAIVAAAAKLIESVGANGFSLRRLAKELGVGPTTIHFHFEGGIRAVSSAVAQQALAGVTRPYKPKEEPASYLGELLLKILEALHGPASSGAPAAASAHDCAADGRSRRIADEGHLGLERLNWAESAPTRSALGRIGVLSESRHSSASPR